MGKKGFFSSLISNFTAKTASDLLQEKMDNDQEVKKINEI